MRPARDFVAECLRRENYGDFIDRAREVVSELVTNVLKHAVQSADDRFAVRFAVVRRGVFLIEVMDRCQRMPVRRRFNEIGELDECGRGLLLVDAMADGWCAFVRQVGGHVVKVVRVAFARSNEGPSGSEHERRRHLYEQINSGNGRGGNCAGVSWYCSER